jgi:hypothetical protein
LRRVHPLLRKTPIKKLAATVAAVIQTQAANAAQWAAVREDGLRRGGERMLGDFDTRGFGLEDTRLRHAGRLDRPVLIMTLAIYWLHRDRLPRRSGGANHAGQTTTANFRTPRMKALVSGSRTVRGNPVVDALSFYYQTLNSSDSLLFGWQNFSDICMGARPPAARLHWVSSAPDWLGRGRRRCFSWSA